MHTFSRSVALTAAIVLSVGLLAGGCSSAPARPAHTKPLLAGRSQPPCQTTMAPGATLSAKTSMLQVSGEPYGVTAVPGGAYAFAATSNPASLLVLSTAGFQPRVVRTVALAGTLGGTALSPDGKYLLVASASGATVINVASAEDGKGNPVLGVLGSTGAGATQVAFSPNGDFAFATLEDSAQAAVFNFTQALASGFAGSGLVGYIPLGLSPVGMAFSPSGGTMYITSENINPNTQEGTLSVVSVARAEADPAHAVLRTVDAGCNPVRVIVSANGQDVWVTARDSDALLAFSAAKLASPAAAKALISWTEVRAAPVDLAFVDGGKLIVVADSNRFAAAGALGDLGVVNVADVLAGRPGLTGKIAAGQFPRQLALEAGGKTLLATNYDSDQIEAVAVSGLR
jgi:hypothetical protein